MQRATLVEARGGGVYGAQLHRPLTLTPTLTPTLRDGAEDGALLGLTLTLTLALALTLTLTLVANPNPIPNPNQARSWPTRCCASSRRTASAATCPASATTRRLRCSPEANSNPIPNPNPYLNNAQAPLLTKLRGGLRSWQTR